MIRLAAVLAAAFASAASALGTWKLDGYGWKYRWIALGGGSYGEIALTRHLTPTDKCPVTPGTLVYKYHPLGNGLYREDQFTWRKDCTTYWDANHETVRIRVTATTMRICVEPGDKDCWSYHRLGDTVAPVVRALPSTGTVGGDTVLRYTVKDASGKTREDAVLYDATGAVARRFHGTLGAAVAGHVYGYRLRETPASWRGRFRFCIQSHDQAGNASRSSCSTVTIK